MSPADREKYRPRSPLELEGENKRIKNEKLTHVSFINFIFIFLWHFPHFSFFFIFGVVIFVLCPKLLNSGGNLLPYFFFLLIVLFFIIIAIFFLFLYYIYFTVRIISTNCDRFYYESWELEWKKVLMGFALSK